jgi:hypothetical protein
MEINTSSLSLKTNKGGRAAIIINLLNNETTELGPNINYYYLAFMFLIGHKNELNNNNNLDQKKSKYYKIILDKNIDLIVFEPKNYS